MKLNAMIAGLVMAGSVVSATAYADGDPASDSIGKVNRVYVAEARGLYIEKKLARHTAGKDIWAHVRSATIVASDATGDMFKVPADLAIERGDLVATQAGDSSAHTLDPNLIATPNKITRLVAPHDSLTAMMFGLPQAATPMVNALLGIKAT